MAAMTPGQRYREIVQAFLQRPGVTLHGRGFGSAALRVRGKMFATLSASGAFVVKLPRPRVDALVAAGHGRPFEPGPGRVMKEWLELNAASGQDWASLADEALAFVAGVSDGRTMRPDRAGEPPTDDREGRTAAGDHASGPD